MLDCEDDVPPVALEEARCAEMLRRLKKATDPATGKSLSVKKVHASFEPDERGLLEVLFLTSDAEPMTAFLRGIELAYVVDGW